MLNHFKIGHFSNIVSGTGCTVILPPAGIVASAAIQGASPGTRELALLSPSKKIDTIHALLLTGGSAFGLGAANGIMKYLANNNIGYKTNYGIVPIVPAAVIFDLNIGDSKSYPEENDALSALKNASFNNTLSGNIGAGTGATVGKWNGIESAMKGGIGIAQNNHGDFHCTVLSVVNSVGDVLYNNNIIAGAIDSDNLFIAEGNPKRRWGKPVVGMAENTILTAVMINADFNKSQIHYLAKRGHYGIAKCVEPSHTSYDGDTLFVLSKREVNINIDTAAMIIIQTVRDSIINGVKNASTLLGFKSVNDLNTL